MTDQIADDLPLDWNVLSCASDSEQQLAVWTAGPATPPTQPCATSPPEPRPLVAPQPIGRT